MKILFIAGGTGGHVYPALSISREFKGKENHISWIGKENSLEEKLCAEEGYEFYSIQGRGFLGKGLLGKTVSLYFFALALVKSSILLIKIRPDFIISTGGYISLAPSLIGSLFYPLFIHEQNSIAGLTNKILHRFSKISFEAFPDTFNRPNRKTLFVGNPVREEIFNFSIQDKEEDSNFNILVLGGSQGSMQINDILMNILLNCSVPSNWNFLHQAGKLDSKLLKAAYEDSGVHFEIKEFTENMPEVYKSSDLIISRSGAMTVSEICAVGKPSILLPLPWASDNHQYMNAKYLEDKGAAEIVGSDISNSEALFKLLIDLENDHNRRESMGQKASLVFPPNTSESICKTINESLKIQTK